MPEISVADQLGMKLKLERTFSRQVRAIFAQQARSFRTDLLEDPFSTVFSRSFLKEWEAFLEVHYERVQKAFFHVNFEFLPDDWNDDDDDELWLLLFWWRKAQAKKQALLISATDFKMKQASVAQARASFADQGKVPSAEEMSLTSTNNLRRKNKARVENITITETQSAAETTKFTEAKQVAKKKPDPEKIILKGWQTRRDKKVRPWHSAAQGQIRHMAEFFNVGGERLMMPGDNSLGASAKNISRCRCFLLYGGLKKLRSRLK